MDALANEHLAAVRTVARLFLINTTHCIESEVYDTLHGLSGVVHWELAGVAVVTELSSGQTKPEELSMIFLTE